MQGHEEQRESSPNCIARTWYEGYGKRSQSRQCGPCVCNFDDNGATRRGKYGCKGTSTFSRVAGSRERECSDHTRRRNRELSTSWMGAKRRLQKTPVRPVRCCHLLDLCSLADPTSLSGICARQQLFCLQRCIAVAHTLSGLALVFFPVVCSASLSTQRLLGHDIRHLVMITRVDFAFPCKLRGRAIRSWIRY